MSVGIQLVLRNSLTHIQFDDYDASCNDGRIVTVINSIINFAKRCQESRDIRWPNFIAVIKILTSSLRDQMHQIVFDYFCLLLRLFLQAFNLWSLAEVVLQVLMILDWNFYLLIFA